MMTIANTLPNTVKPFTSCPPSKLNTFFNIVWLSTCPFIALSKISFISIPSKNSPEYSSVFSINSPIPNSSCCSSKVSSSVAI